MSKKFHGIKKGINPALLYMSEEAKAKTAVKASSEAIKLLTLKILHDTFGFGEQRRKQFMEEFSRQMEMYEEGYYSYEDLKNLVEIGLKGKPRRKAVQNG